MTKRSPKEQSGGQETKAQICRRVGISRKQAHEWIKLAEAPADEFDALLASPDVRTMGQRYQAIVTAPVGGRGRVAKPAARMLDALLALELQFSTLDEIALADQDAAQRAAFLRVVPSLIGSLLNLQRSTS